MKTPQDLTRVELERLVYTVQVQLWEGSDGNGRARWDADHEWGVDNIEEIAYAFTQAGLRPEWGHDNG